MRTTVRRYQHALPATCKSLSFHLCFQFKMRIVLLLHVEILQTMYVILPPTHVKVGDYGEINHLENI